MIGLTSSQHFLFVWKLVISPAFSLFPIPPPFVFSLPLISPSTFLTLTILRVPLYDSFAYINVEDMISKTTEQWHHGYLLDLQKSN